MRKKKQILIVVLLLVALSGVVGISIVSFRSGGTRLPFQESRGDAARSLCGTDKRPDALVGSDLISERTRLIRPAKSGVETRDKMECVGGKEERVAGNRRGEDGMPGLDERVEKLVTGEYVPHEVLVRFVVDAAQEEIDSVIGKVNTVRVRRIRSKADAVQGALYRLYLAGTVSVADALKILLPEPAVKYAEPNYISHAAYVPNDPYYTNGWLWNLVRIGAPAAWDKSTGVGIVVAVIDTGCEMYHVDLAANIWTNPGETPDNGIDDDSNGYVDDYSGWDFAYDDNDPSEGFGHGVHVTGTIGAVGGNGTGVIGLAFKAELMILKGIDDADNIYESDMAEAIYYAVDNGARVINISAYGNSYSQVEYDAAQYARNNDCVVVACAGNEGWSQRGYPAGYDNTIAVGATDSADQRWASSNYGVWLDVVAPGVEILSTFLTNQYATWTGTSMATPHVSGLAALMLSKDPNLTFVQVRDLIRANAVDLGVPGRDDYYGYGRIDAPATLDAMQLPDPEVTIVSVTPSNGLVGPNVFAVAIRWQSNAGGTCYLEVGGTGTLGTGLQLDYGYCGADMLMEITVYEIEIDDNTAQNVYIIVDTGTQTAFNSVLITDDHTAPTSTVTSPDDGSTTDSVDTITGSVSDAGGSTVASVEICIFDGTKYYSPGSGFSSSTPVWIIPSGMTSWSYDTSAVPWSQGSTYTILSRATDAIGNVETPGTGSVFTFGEVVVPPPPPPTTTAKKSKGGCALSNGSPAPASTFLFLALLGLMLALRRLWNHPRCKQRG